MADKPTTPTNETDDTAPLNETDNEHIKLWIMEDVIIPTEILNDRTGLQPDALAPVLCWMMHEAIKNPKRNIISAFNLKEVLLHRLIRAKNVESNHTTWVEGATFAEPHQVFSARIDDALSYATNKGWLKIDAAVQSSFGGKVNITAEGCTIATGLLAVKEPDATGNGKPAPEAPAKRLRRRSKKGQAKYWHPRALDYIRETKGEISDAKIAELCEVAPSVVCRDKVVQALKASYVRR